MKKIYAFSVALVLSMSLAACGNSSDDQATSGTTESSAAATQTVEEACAIVEENMTAFQTKYQESAADLATNPEKAVEMLKEMQTELEQTSSKIGNAEVAEVWGSFVSGVAALASATESMDVEALQTGTTDMTNGMVKISEICGVATN